ncbi:DUF3159 domain-containing protein [Actinophytocola gossypii]|uniref:DUF3159 domain-containing protein n=1 Tax=Actinophytocola gossypii TaxID=2812003 RepID=A0ABT2J8F1_9PSEU|nr:DUF3159 domain-containing protein [Actinophytocola gossypii]MCT2583976.1 DUF3159 domain-containing protein [Actinophytocola gossypii]
MTEPDRSPSPPTSTEEPEQEKEKQPTLLEQMGGITGLVYSTIPVLVFILINSLFGLTAAIWSALGSAVAITVIRLVRKEPLQPAISGFFGVAIAAFIAYRTGDAKGFFLFGIWTSLVYGSVFLVSVLVRWPLVGVIWSYLNGHGMLWRGDRRAVRVYSIATLTWMSVFAARFVVQRWLYDEDQTGWLGFARLAMGYPLTAVALLVTVWAVRAAGHRQKDIQAAAEARAAEERELEAKLRAKYGGPAPESS